MDGEIADILEDCDDGRWDYQTRTRIKQWKPLDIIGSTDTAERQCIYNTKRSLS